MPGARLLGTTNPDSPRHCFKVNYLDRQSELDMPAEYSGLWRRRMIDGAWVIAEGAVFDMYDEQRHVGTELPPMRRYWTGVDYGTVNPFAALTLGLGDDGRLYVTSEWRHDSRAAHRQLTDAQYSRAVGAWLDDLDV